MIIIVQVKARAKGLRERVGDSFWPDSDIHVDLFAAWGTHTHTGRMIYMLQTVVVFMKTNKYADAVIKAQNVAH